MSAQHADKVRLEVDASDVTNVISNHSGQGGATTGWTGETGWTLAAVTNPTRGAETLQGAYTGGKTIRATHSGGSSGSRVLGPSFAVTAGDSVGGWFSLADSQVITPGDLLTFLCGFYFYDAAAALVGTYTYPLFRQLTEGDAPWRMAEFTGGVGTVPVGAVSARMWWTFYDGSQFGGPANRDLYLSKVMIVKSSGPDGSATVRDVPFSDTTVWQDVLGSATSAKITRGGRVSGVLDEIEPGTLTATVTDPVVDPAQNPRMRRGRKVRFMALDDASVWRPLFTGRVENLDVVYVDKFDPSARPRVTITAVDAIAELAKTSQPFNYSGAYGPKVKALMAVSSVPYVADAGTASTVINHRDRGKLWDQLELARNTFSGGRLWVDAAGTLHAVTVTPSGVAEHEFHDRTARSFTNVVTNPSFETNATGLTTDITGVTMAQSAAWSEQGTKSALVSKSSATNTSISQFVATPDGSQRIAVSAAEFFSARVAVKAVIAFSNFQLTAQEYNGASSLGAAYVIGSSGAVAAGGVAVVQAKHVQPTNPATTHVVLRLLSSATASTGSMFYTDGWCYIKEGAEAAGWDTVPYADAAGLWEPVGTPYTDVDVRYGAEALVNELMIVANNASEADGSKEYGPYTNAASQTNWGVAPARVETVDPASPSTLAGTYLERFADPVIFPRSVQFRAQDADSEALFTDLYDECRVAHRPSGTDAVVPVIRIEHVITPQRWDVTLGFRPEESSTVTVTNPAAGADTGPDDVAGAPSGGCFGSRGLSTSGGQVISTSTLTTVQLNLDVESTNITWDGTNYEYELPYSGRYLIIGKVTYKPGATSDYFQAVILVNGSEVATDLGPFPVSQYNARTVTEIRRLVKGDKVRLSTYQTSGASRTLHESADGRFCYLRITYLGV